MALISSDGLYRTYLDAGLPEEPQTEEEAHQVLKAIQASKGYLSTATLLYLEEAPPETRREIHRGFESLRVEAAAFTNSITTKQNSLAFHFIYELLQNADDAVYALGRQRNVGGPWIHFLVDPEKIIVETNELGFSRRNVEAICATGRSCKEGSNEDQHIGEKGFGFKSVFLVAKEAQIRSRVWSFHFEHGDNDQGLGMVTPIIDSMFPLPPGTGTRITLTLNDTYRNDYQRLAKEFEELSDTTFLFLQQISDVVIRVKREDGSQYRASYTKVIESERSRLVKRTGSPDGDGQQVETQYHQLYQRTVQSMPLDHARKGKTTAPLILAFPTDSDGKVAIIEPRGQYCFAFLPLGRLQPLKFLIHSDFIVSAGRESTIDCKWNDRLRDETADAFCAAIEHFCAKGILVHDWTRFVPQLHMDGYWQPLKQKSSLASNAGEYLKPGKGVCILLPTK